MQNEPHPQQAHHALKIKRIALFVALFFVAWFLRVLLFLIFDRQLPTQALRSLSSFAFRMLVWVVPVFVYLYWIDKTAPLRYLKLTTSWRKGLSISLAIIVLGAIVQLLLLRTGIDALATPFNGWELFNAVLVPSFNEELLMRGFILNKVREITVFWKANLIVTLLFVAIHWPGWLLLSNMDISQMVIASAQFVPLSLVLGYLVKKSNSLFPSISLHAVNNFVSAM